MSALLTAVLVGAAFLIGFALGNEYGARRVLRMWDEAVRGPIEKTSEREGRMR